MPHGCFMQDVCRNPALFRRKTKCNRKVVKRLQVCGVVQSIPRNYNIISQSGADPDFFMPAGNAHRQSADEHETLSAGQVLYNCARFSAPASRQKEKCAQEDPIKLLIQAAFFVPVYLSEQTGFKTWNDPGQDNLLGQMPSWKRRKDWPCRGATDCNDSGQDKCAQATDKLEAQEGGAA